MSQAIILAGGRGTRMGEETLVIPKPMVKIGRMPILWHIMKNLYMQGIEDFIILTGYKGEVIREFFRNYADYIFPAMQYSGKTYIGVSRGIPLYTAYATYQEDIRENWSVVVLDTGLDTPTAGRLLQAKNWIMGDFILTYGDGLANIDTEKLSEQANGSDSLVTVTAMHPPGRFGALQICGENGKIVKFEEKPLDHTWVNGGFMYMKPAALNYFRENEMLEMGSLQRLIGQGWLEAYKHTGFWHPMDTLRDKEYLEELWNTGKAPWKNWEEK